MRQVPASFSYLLVGRGRVARHFATYFRFLGLTFSTWDRSEDLSAFRSRALEASHVLLLITDQEIEASYRAHDELKGRTVVHFSGALYSSFVSGAHPLMTFSHRLYELAFYRSIPFVFDHGALEFSELLPGLPNPSFRIAPEEKARYHALCVLSGNFTVLLWEKAFKEFASRFAFDQAILYPYLRVTAENLIDAEPGKSVLTGPLARGDQATIGKNLQALGDDPYAGVYRSFIKAMEEAGR